MNRIYLLVYSCIMVLLTILSEHNNCTSFCSLTPYDDSIKLLREHLEKHVKLINYFYENGQKLHVRPVYCLDLSYYKHELSRLCVKKIIHSQSLKSILEVWDVFWAMYRTIDPRLFLGEFSIILFCVYKDLLLELCEYTHIRVSIVEIIELSDKIASLPIEQILEVLEQCYNKFFIIMHDYGFHSDLNWTEWLREYWWVPPIAITVVVYIVLKYKITKPIVPLDEEIKTIWLG